MEKFRKLTEKLESFLKMGLLVLSTDLALSRIADTCGFGDYLSFYEAYVKRFGISPSAARKTR